MFNLSNFWGAVHFDTTSWLSKVGISSCKINVTGTNLFSFFNPYPESYTDPLTGYGTFPALRSWTVGLNLSF